MGPTLEHFMTVQTSIEPGSRPSTARSWKIPFQYLNRSVQSMHSRGMRIQGMGLCVGAQTQATNPDPVTGSGAAKTVPSESTPKKAGRRNSRRRRG